MPKKKIKRHNKKVTIASSDSVFNMIVAGCISALIFALVVMVVIAMQSSAL